MTIEIYKDVVGYEGLYQVSNLGNVKSFIKNNVNGKIIKPINNGTGYYRVGLCINNKQRYFLIHRLVANAFIDNPNNYNQVNHINGIKSHNNVNNLEWCNQSHNNNHALKSGLRVHPIGDKHKLSKKIINIQSGEIYYSALTLSLKLGINRVTLYRMLNGRTINKTNFKYL